jgi:hypothetical protein
MAEYRLTASEVVQRMRDNVQFPNDPKNADRVEYDAWLAAGGVPDPYVPPIGTSQYDWGGRFAEILGRY